MSSLAELPELIGFFSYSRQDDVDSLGALSDLRDRIYRELSMRLGRGERDFRLWQDKAAIPFGALWKDEITRAIEESAFFIPIISPRTIRSEHCKFEFDAFLAREKALGRDNLVFPILYIEVQGLDRQDHQRSNDILRIVNDRQFADWRAIRHLDVGSVEIKQRIETFCRNIVGALERTSTRQRMAAPVHDPPADGRDLGAARPFADIIDDVTPPSSFDPRGRSGQSRAAPGPQPRSEAPLRSGRPYLLAAIGLACLCAGLAAAIVFRAAPQGVSPKLGASDQATSPVQSPVAPRPFPSPAPQKIAVDGGFPIAVGDSVADVRRAYPMSPMPTPMGGPSSGKTQIRLEDLGIWFFFDSEGKIYTVRFDRPWSGSVQGIAIGDTKAKIEAVLGTPNGSDSPSHGGGSYYYDDRYVYRRAGRHISIYFLDSANTVDKIMVP